MRMNGRIEGQKEDGQSDQHSPDRQKGSGSARARERKIERKRIHGLVGRQTMVNRSGVRAGRQAGRQANRQAGWQAGRQVGR